MKIGELSKRTDCSIQTIRYYEKEKLLQSIQRSEGNYRLYDEAAVEQLGFIKLCRSLDLSLSEIRQLIALKRSPNAQCDEVNLMMDKHIDQVERRIDELSKLREQLITLRDCCSDERTVAQCGILKTLAVNK
jgi:Cd(II)/Pb(II)-responsive transcriptional regulator